MLTENRLLALTGFALIAVTYGLARFSWGLMLPDIMQNIHLSSAMAGSISSVSFTAYCVAIVFSSVCTGKTGPRFPAVLAGLFAAAGMGIIALSDTAAGMVCGVAFAGISTGLVSPPMAEAVKRKVAEKRRSVINTLINAGTGGGIIFSALAVLFLTNNWRATYLFFTFITLMTVLLSLKIMPTGPDGEKFSLRQQFSAFLLPALRSPLIVAFLSGLVSAAYWTFGPVMFHSLGGMERNEITLLWLITGVTGCAGIMTGALINRFGVNSVHRLMQALTILSFLLLALSPHYQLLPYIVSALYGFAYITLSGVLLVSGVNSAGSLPAAGLGAVFLMLAIGQVIGASLFGWLYDITGAAVALLLFSAVALLAMFLRAEQ